MTFGSREFLGGPGDCLFLRILTAEYGGLKTRTYGHISEIWLTNPALLDSSLRWNDVTAAVVYPRDCRYNALLL